MSKVARRGDKGKGKSRDRTQTQDDENADAGHPLYDTLPADTPGGATGYPLVDVDYHDPSSPNYYTHVPSEPSYFLPTTPSQGDDTTPGTVASSSPHLYHGTGYESQDQPRLAYDPRQAQVPYYQDPQATYDDANGDLSAEFGAASITDTGDQYPSEWAQNYDTNTGEAPYHAEDQGCTELEADLGTSKEYYGSPSGGEYQDPEVSSHVQQTRPCFAFVNVQQYGSCANARSSTASPYIL